MIRRLVTKSHKPLTVGEEDILILSDSALKLYMYYMSLPFDTNPTQELAIEYLQWSEGKYKKYKKELMDKKYIMTRKHSVKGGGTRYDYYVGRAAVAERIEQIRLEKDNGN